MYKYGIIETYLDPKCNYLGPFNNYVDKMRGGGQRMSVFVHAPGINRDDFRFPNQGGQAVMWWA